MENERELTSNERMLLMGVKAAYDEFGTMPPVRVIVKALPLSQAEVEAALQTLERGGYLQQIRDAAELRATLTFEKQVGQATKRLRKARGWSQADLAERMKQYGVDMHQTTVAKLEAADRPIRVNELGILALLFEVDVQEILAGPKVDTSPAVELKAKLIDTRRRANAARREAASLELQHANVAERAERLQAECQLLERKIFKMEDVGGERQEAT